MKDKHGIGFNCPQCNEYCLFEEHLEEHMDEHIEREEYIEPSGFQCVECNEFFESVDDVIDHENEGECDQCGKWLGCGTNMEKHKKKEHEYIELEIESHRGAQALCAENLYMETPGFSNENCSEEGLKIDGDNYGKNFESTDEKDEENKVEIEEIENEVGVKI